MVPPQSLENALSSKSSSKPLDFHVLTLFPELFPPVLESSLLGKAQKRGLVSYTLTQIRDFAQDKHRTVDDTPYGGGEGMVLRCDVLHSAWESAAGVPSGDEGSNPTVSTQKTCTILLSPQGELWNQELAKEILRDFDRVVLVCGHYEGVDERFIELCVDREISIGDYVLTGGELPALVLMDSLTRLIPGVVGNERSLTEESLENDLLKYPQYTRPPEYQGLKVPEVLTSGNHKAIAEWRLKQMKERTARKRPDLAAKKKS